MIGSDFEVFRYDWLVVCKDLITDESEVINNDKDKLQKFVDDHKNNLLIGYNSSNYDNFILKGILLGKDPYYLSNIIINQKDNTGRIWRMANWNDIKIFTYDVSFGLGFTSLKENEAYLGISIDECPVDFNMEKPLSKKELDLVINYCKRDVDATQLLFEKSKEKFETKLYLCNEFGLDKSYLNKGDQSIIE